MVSLVFLFTYLLTITSTLASPPPLKGIKIPPIDPERILCQLPIIGHFLCPPTGSSALNRQTVLGNARGTLTPSGAGRFAVRYANANRWAPSTIATTWDLPNGSTNVSGLPLACPQDGVDPSAYTEDCLSMVLYVPSSLTLTSAAPVLMWVHGGSFIVGSASAPGLDGSKLASATNSIVAVVQYRLGALGFLSPDGTTNNAVKDVVNAMQFLKKVVPAFGGSGSKITLAGQSSGANMIRALLAVPSASSLFKSAILQSDPMNFGFLKPSTHQALLANFTGSIGCDTSDKGCLNALPVNTILGVQSSIFGNAVSIDPSAGSAEPIRPTRDGIFITSSLDSTGPFPQVNKPLIISTVQEEAGPAIYSGFQFPLPEDTFEPICSMTFNPVRTQIIVSSPYYTPTPADQSDARARLQRLGTDYIWKCSSWTFSRNWVQNGGTAYVGQYIVGSTYPENELVPFCTQPGVVCHQDDIEIVFGTVPNPTSVQSALIDQMQRHYKAFLTSGNPNAAGLPNWPASTSSVVNAIQLGGTGSTPIGACDPSFWGSGVQYDYQFFGM